jgi:hypothetical protein
MDDAVKACEIANGGRTENYREGSQAELAADFLKRNIVSRFGEGAI